MKKLIALLFTLILFHGGTRSQDVLNDIVKSYFRSNPFIGNFGDFLNHLIHDPSIVNKVMQKRTDTSFFYFKGQYTSHNPFPFTSIRTEVMLTEAAEKISDSLPQADTFFVYQLIGYTIAGKDGLDEVKKEYQRFDRKFGKKFADAEPSALTQDGESVGEIRNYFFPFFILSPVSAGWAIMKGKNENLFAITLRMKRRQ